jgi:hypothetical protein
MQWILEKSLPKIIMVARPEEVNLSGRCMASFIYVLLLPPLTFLRLTNESFRIRTSAVDVMTERVSKRDRSESDRYGCAQRRVWCLSVREALPKPAAAPKSLSKELCRKLCSGSSLHPVFRHEVHGKSL